ncbi:putative Bifunctional protein FolD [Paratrimastix pyriformis]|uniref:Bifunctional protein FolD n=1 Tax=Paratrimastix pyriformis TaxID=342808 RepID=A0ABQ8UQM9_9EUKA|nr:putative Bifunctional protein FolD [Paratrimastix pyriformis]
MSTPAAPAPAPAPATAECQLIQGRPIAQRIQADLKTEIEQLRAQNVALKLVAVMVGENAGSTVYVNQQRKLADSMGIAYELMQLPGTSTEADVIQVVERLNADPAVTGVILQQPMPQQIAIRNIIEKLNPAKDAEGMHPNSLGHVLMGDAHVAPCTASAVMEILAAQGMNLYGKEVVIVGHSDIVGKPLTLMMLNKFGTTTTCHIATSQAHKLQDHLATAEVVVVAVGVARLIKGEWLRPGTVLIDVGINKVGDQIVGDADFESCKLKCAAITPVPGGVGPLTNTMLMKNLVALARAAHH